MRSHPSILVRAATVLVGGCFAACNDDSASWQSTLTVVSADVVSIAGSAYGSSSKLTVSWRAAPVGTVKQRLTTTAALSGTVNHHDLDATATTATLADLDSASDYTVTLSACRDAACAEVVDGGRVSASTAEEVWQLRGSGASVAGLTKIVSDGNVRIHAIRYGADAPAAVAGRTQLYYGPMPSPGSPSKLSVATGDAVATADIASVDSFTSQAEVAGLASPSSPAPLVSKIMTGQGVPLKQGGVVRLYFEASGADKKTRILSIDSKDGYIGQDFHSGAGTLCSTTSDFSPGGGCAPAVALGVEGDAIASTSAQNVRQFKIGYPLLDDWRWDELPGAFMFVTVDASPACGATSTNNQAYAVYDGTQWNVDYASQGCMALLTAAQAATPLHVGGVRYKVYMGDRTDEAGKLPGSTLPFLGPKVILHGDGARTGDPTVVDFEDWDARAAARGTTWLWPDGSALDATAEGYIDDFVAITPTGSVDFQVLYVAITDGTSPPLSAVALLVNP